MPKSPTGHGRLAHGSVIAALTPSGTPSPFGSTAKRTTPGSAVSVRPVHFKAYALDDMEHLMKTGFTPEKIGAKADGFWPRKAEAAYLEADAPQGAPHTQRTYTNDELYKHNKESWTIRKNGLSAIAIREFVERRRASAPWQIGQIRRDFHVRSGVDFAGGKVEP